MDLFVLTCSCDASAASHHIYCAPEPRIHFLLSCIPTPDHGQRIDLRFFPEFGLPYQPLIRPPIVAMPPCELSFAPLFTALTPQAICTLLALLLTEQKILVHARVAAVASDATIILRSLLFPLHWELFFVPIVPLNMLGFLGERVFLWSVIAGCTYDERVTVVLSVCLDVCRRTNIVSGGNGDCCCPR